MSSEFKGTTICFTCSGVMPGDVGCCSICAGGVTARLFAIVGFSLDESQWKIRDE